MKKRPLDAVHARKRYVAIPKDFFKDLRYEFKVDLPGLSKSLCVCGNPLCDLWQLN